MPHTDREYSPFDFRDRVESAARAGFKGFGLWHADLEHVLQTRSLREMKQIFDDNGIKHIELEFLTDWFLNGERKKQSDIRKKLLLHAAEALGAHHVKVGDFFHEKAEMPHLIESFARLCAEGAERATKIGFELMPFAMIDTLEDSLKLVEGAGARFRPNTSRASNSTTVLLSVRGLSMKTQSIIAASAAKVNSMSKALSSRFAVRGTKGHGELKCFPKSCGNGRSNG
jgi:hypothetical protein